jgi:hypothetical protein
MVRLTIISVSILLRDIRLATSLCKFTITTESMKEMAFVLETKKNYSRNVVTIAKLIRTSC